MSNPNDKYELTTETKVNTFGVTLFRIRSIISGELGGWVESEKNLSVSDNAWVSDNAEIFDNAWVSGDAWVFDNAQICGKAWVSDNAWVSNNAWVSGDAWITETNRNESTEASKALPVSPGSVVYLSGAISSDPDFKAKFALWAGRLLAAGAKRVLDPAQLPEGWEYGEYMEHCMLMVRRANLLVMLPCWRQSPGARAEKAYAESLQIPVIDLSQKAEDRHE